MTQWVFVMAAYGLTFVAATVVSVSSWVAMRKAEAASAQLKR